MAIKSTDPLEAAKINAQGEPARPRVKAETPKVIVPAKISRIGPEVPETFQRYYRCVNGGHMSWSGSVTHVHPNQILDMTCYGPGALDMFRTAGFVLEPVTK